MMSLISPIYKTAPWGYDSDNYFYNQVVALDTYLDPEELLFATQKIEKELGRVLKSENGYTDRPIDIDILLYADIKLNTQELTIPHIELANRRFVLQPLADIAPNKIISALHSSVSELLMATSDTSTLELVIDNVELDD